MNRFETGHQSAATGHALLPVVLALCLLLAACGLISIGVSNSPDWCPSKESKGCL